MTTRLVSVVIDSADPVPLADWWADALGWAVEHHRDESDVTPPPGEPGIELTFVPDGGPKQGKNRLHLDLFSADADEHLGLVSRLLLAGARRIDVGQHARPGGAPWVVMADPEGNEFCVLEPRPAFGPVGAVAAIVHECVDPAAMATFWTAAAGMKILEQREDLAVLVAPDGRGPWLALVGGGQPHSVKNHLHLDVAGFADDDQDAEVSRLLALGARRIDIGQHELPPDKLTWVVLADPEDNEFCVLSSRG